MIEDGIYDVQATQTRQRYEEGKRTGEVPRAEIKSNAPPAWRKPWGEYPDLPTEEPKP